MANIAVTLVNESLAHARNGEVVLYKRGDSKRWQARFKLKDLKWHRVATKHVNIQFAAETACEAYDRARFLYDEKIPITSKRFDSVADIAVDEMEKQLKAGVGKSVYNDYISVIKKYLKPFFGAKAINTIGYEEIKKYSDWRTVQMKKPPVASTVTTHISAFNRVFDCAVERGWIAAALSLPPTSQYNCLWHTHLCTLSLWVNQVRHSVSDCGTSINIGAYSQRRLLFQI